MIVSYNVDFSDRHGVFDSVTLEKISDAVDYAYGALYDY